MLSGATQVDRILRCGCIELRKWMSNDSLKLLKGIVDIRIFILAIKIHIKHMDCVCYLMMIIWASVFISQHPHTLQKEAYFLKF